MKLTRIEIDSFRKFRKPVVIDGLQGGLNVLHGPNEAGKSTIARAIRVVFFERHGVGGESVRTELRPVDMPEAAPRIRIDFELGGQAGHIAKTFLKQPRAMLVIGNENWNGEGADEEMAKRLGFGFAGKGASAPGHQGIPGLLWITQGECVELSSRVDAARATLRERLAPVLGGLASTSGSEVLAQLERSLYEIQTPEGRPRGAYRDAIARVDQCEKADVELNTKAIRFRTDSDAVAQAIKDQKSLETARPWDDLEAKIAEVARAIIHAGTRRSFVDGLIAQKQQRDVTIIELRRQVDSRKEQLAKLATYREKLDGLQAAAAPATCAWTTAQQALDEARGLLDAAREHRRRANQYQERKRREGERTRDQQELERVRKVVAIDAEHHQALLLLRTQCAEVQHDPKEVAALIKCESDLKDATIRRDAVATRVSYVLRPGANIDGGAHGTLSGEGEFRITRPLDLSIPGLGSLRIMPGGESVDTLDGACRNLEIAVDELRVRLGVADAAVASGHMESANDLRQKISVREAQRTQVLDGASVEVWLARAASLDIAIAEHDKKLKELADIPDVQSTPGQADRAFEAAEHAVELALESETNARARYDQNRMDLQSLSSRITADSDRLESRAVIAEAGERDVLLQKELGLQEELRLQISNGERDLADLHPQDLEDDAQRLRLSLNAAMNRRSELGKTIASLTSGLNALGADGVDEDAAKARLSLETARQRRDQLGLRADALRLLCARLREHQRQATEKLYAPLLGKLQRYLGLLFPDSIARIVVEDLETTAMHRDGLALAMDAYSYGTREQLSVLVRLAYADLLKEAGQPTLLILDDALVHSDAGRRGQMQRVLFEAAKRHQVLLFTCRPDDWLGAGARQEIDVGKVVGAV